MPGYARIDKVSFLHRLDPRTKLFVMTLFSVLVFIVNVPLLAAAQVLVFTGLCLAAGITLRQIFPHVKILLFLVALVIAVQVLFGQGLFVGVLIACRIAALTVIMPALALTTDPRLLALGITRLGINYKAAFIITSTFNLIPLFEEEARLIIDARKLRGMQSVKLMEYPAIALPLMVKAMRQAQMMGLAMDARAFGAYKTRTWLHTIRLSAIDYGAIAAGMGYSALMIAANCLLQG